MKKLKITTNKLNTPSMRERLWAAQKGRTSSRFGLHLANTIFLKELKNTGIRLDK